MALKLVRRVKDLVVVARVVVELQGVVTEEELAGTGENALHDCLVEGGDGPLQGESLHGLFGDVHGVHKSAGLLGRGQCHVLGVVARVLEPQSFLAGTHERGLFTEVEGRAQHDHVRLVCHVEHWRKIVLQGATAIGGAAQKLAAKSSLRIP